MPTHTPGPWEAEQRGKDWGIWCQFPYTRVLSIRTGVIPDPANARLIAAAPELMEALRAILNGQLVGQVDTSAERFREARALLARIEGRPC